MKTEFEIKNAVFTDKAHLAAQDQLYKLFFNGLPISFISTSLYKDISNNVLDGELGIDRFVNVSCNLKQDISFSIQERFRRVKFSKYKDITITEWNYNSDLPSELYKIQSDYFVYGYFNENLNTITEAIIIPTLELKKAIVRKDLYFKKERNKKNQSFITIKFDDIIENKNINHFQYSFQTELDF